MKWNDDGLSLEQWRESFRFESPEDEALFAQYCNELAGDRRFKRLLNQMEAVLTLLWKQTHADDRERLLVLKMRMEGVQMLREAVLAGRASLIVADQDLTD